MLETDALLKEFDACIHDLEAGMMVLQRCIYKNKFSFQVNY